MLICLLPSCLFLPLPSPEEHNTKISTQTKGQQACHWYKKQVMSTVAQVFDSWLPDFSKPPPPRIQKANALLQQEPYSYVANGVFWGAVFLFWMPLIGVAYLVYSGAMALLYIVRDKDQQVVDPCSTASLAVVITGCDSGFGKEIALHLCQKGFIVFCGCYSKDSFGHFDHVSGAIPMVLDVTNPQHVAEAVAKVDQWMLSGSKGEATKSRHLHALINIAGVGLGGLIDWCRMEDWKVSMEVNCFGMIRMVKAFLPLFKRQAFAKTYPHARIMNMTSVAGMIRTGGVGLSPYEVSKNAAESFSHGLRLEMKHFGIPVVTINPSFHNTQIIQDAGQRMAGKNWESLNPEVKDQYGEDFADVLREMGDFGTNVAKWDLGPAVDQIVAGVLSKRPPVQMLIGSDARYVFAPLTMLPMAVQGAFYGMIAPENTPAAMQQSPKKG